MKIGGLEKLTLIDYPGELAAIIFTSGCNFRCHFCYNPMLVVPNGHSLIIDEGDLLNFLQSRRSKLGGIVVTGGEPTLHHDLPEFLGKIKDLGYKIKLDTNGTNPEMLEKVIGAGLVDYIAMDIKGPLEKYEQIAGVAVDLENIKKSVKIIIGSALPYEFRTTLVPGIHDKKDIDRMGEIVASASFSRPDFGELSRTELGTKAAQVKADKWFLQFFKSDTGLIDRSLEGKSAFTQADMEEMRRAGEKYAKKCEIRG